MVDDIELDVGSGGAKIKTDDDGTAHWQYMKVAFGPDNTQNIVGSISSNPLPVALSDVDNAVLDAIAASLALLDNSIQSGNELQVDVVASLPAGTNAIGKLAANSGVDIGDVDVTSVIPGTGATNLGKPIGTAVGATDTGVLMLGVHDAESTKVAVSEEQFDHLHIDELGALSVSPEQHNHLDEMDATTGWTVLGNDTLSLATTLNHLTGSNALTFDKVDGAANTVVAGIQKTITTIDMGELDLHDVVQTVCFVSSIANVDFIFVRIGTDSTNYNEWRVQDTELIAGEFQILGLSIGLASQAGNTGNGVNWGAISYIAVGVSFDTQNNTLSGIIFDQIGIFTGSHTTANIGAEVSTSVSSPNVNVKKWGSTSVTLNAGNADTGTLRVVLATDQNFIRIEDVQHVSGEAGVMALAVRNDVLAALAGTDGDYAPLQVNASGALFIQEGAALDVSAATVTIAGTGTLVVQEDGAALTSLQLIDNIVLLEDAVHGSGDPGVMSLVVRNDVLATLVDTDGDYAPLQVNASGALYIQEGSALDVSAATLTVNAHAVTNAGTFVVQEDGAALTALQLIDDVVYAEDVAAQAADPGVAVMAVRTDELTAGGGAADGDYMPIRADHFGRLRVTNIGDATSIVKYGVIDVASSGNNTIQASAGSGKKIKVLSAFLISAGTVTARFEDGADGTALTGQMNLVVNTGFVLPYNPEGWFETSDDTLLNLELSAGVSVDGCFSYVED